MFASLLLSLLTPTVIVALPSGGGWRPPPGNETLPPVYVTFDTFHGLPRDVVEGYPLSFILPEKSFASQNQVLVPMKAIEQKYKVECALSGHMEQNFRCKKDIADIGPAVSFNCSSWPFPFDHQNDKVGLRECRIMNIHADPVTPADPEPIVLKYHLDHVPAKTSPMPLRFSAYHQNGIGDGTTETAMLILEKTFRVGQCEIDRWWPSDIWCQQDDTDGLQNATMVQLDCLRERIFGVRTCSAPKLIFS